MHDGQLVYNTADLEGSSDNKGRQWGEKWNGKAPGQRHHANMTEAAGAYERRVKRYRERPAVGRGKMLQAK